jgi:hypothetical protein
MDTTQECLQTNNKGLQKHQQLLPDTEKMWLEIPDLHSLAQYSKSTNPIKNINIEFIAAD